MSADGSRGDIVHLRSAGVSLILDCRGPGLPEVLHWGADLGKLSQLALEAVALAAAAPVASGSLDEPARLSLLPEHGTGWPGMPGLTGHRAGRDWSPVFVLSKVDRMPGEAPSGSGERIVISASDPVASLGLTITVELAGSGVVRQQAALINLHPSASYTLDGLTLALPVPTDASELLDLTGRHLRERSPQRRPFHVGAIVRDNRRGRTGADATLVLVAGARGFGFRSGQVWGLHVGWSGNHCTYAERLPSGAAVLGGGELLLPGEILLAPGAEYRGPWLYGSYGQGLDELSARFHEYLRSRPSHPAASRPRPVVLNTWEAVYFDHDTARLTNLADLAAEVGVERFVLDDGWFRHRRDDTAGLGDWFVDEQIWPEGLHPLIRHVQGLGMQFGLWVEPEMVNPNSDLARAHPSWVLATGGRQPRPARHQQVLDLGNPAAYSYIADRLDALLEEYEISYLKWDHNRDLVDAGHPPGGEPGVHAQTVAVYRLLDELRAKHPGLEIESCSSGGGRVDLGIVQRTDRVWASDCNDPLERQSIQRWTALLLPPELIGSHVGPARAHTTGRTHDLAFRAGTALFGHFGIEADLAAMTAAERAELTRWVACYKQVRGLVDGGVTVRGDHPDPALWIHGVVAADRSEALYAVVAMTTGVTATPGRVRLPGLAPDGTYWVRAVPPGDQPEGLTARATPSWMRAGGVMLSGRTLIEIGLQAPLLHPEQLVLLRLTSA